MTKPDRIESGVVERGGGRSKRTVRTQDALTFARRRVVVPARALLVTMGPLGAALWALYPVAIVLLIVGFLFAGSGSI